MTVAHQHEACIASICWSAASTKARIAEDGYPAPPALAQERATAFRWRRRRRQCKQTTRCKLAFSCFEVLFLRPGKPRFDIGSLFGDIACDTSLGAEIRLKASKSL
jgi:hypothetical protein